MVNVVEVELIENPQVRRMMTVNSFKQNQSRWRLVKADSTLTEKKPAVVAPEGVTAPLPSLPQTADDSSAEDFPPIDAGLQEVAPEEDAPEDVKPKGKKK